MRVRHRLIGLALLLTALALAVPAAARTLRWTSQGDLLSMDPHAHNESLTNQIVGQVYETLVNRDRQLRLVPVLATGWQQLAPTHWRFELRRGVRFHDGSAFSADDVVFSVQRAQAGSSDIRVYADALGTPRAVDAHTVEFRLAAVNPVFLEHLSTVPVMSRAWSERHGATRPLDVRERGESHAARHANGTGPFVLVEREPDVKTVFRRHPHWWGRFEGNLDEVVYRPIRSDATRLAALVSGQVDLVLDPSPQDVIRLRRLPDLQVIEGPENRILFIGMDQSRDALLHGRVPGGGNPFKDLRVRRALYQAIDIEAIRAKLMRGQARPTGGITPSPAGAYHDAALEQRLPHDRAAARRLLAEAGYPDGFEVTLDCPNNRYIQDEELCTALAAMWAHVGVRVRVNAMPRTLYFAKLQRRDTSLYLLGWGGSITDAETTLTPLLRTPGADGVGSWNFGGASDARLDALAAASSRESDPVRREALVKAALRRQQELVLYLPLHRQIVPWAARAGVSVVHRADNWLEWQWIRLP